MSGNQGLSPKSSMSDEQREAIHEKGGKASHSGGNGSQKSGSVTRNRAGGGALDTAAQRKGGQNSHKNQ